MRAVARIDDQRVEISVGQLGAVGDERATAVVGHAQTVAEHVHAILVPRVDHDLAEVERARRERVDPLPVLSRVE